MEKLRQRTSQADVARAAGVSISTVSRVLSDAPGISDDVRRDVRSAAEQLGYRHRTLNRAPELREIIGYLPVRQATGSVASMYEAIMEGLTAESRRLGIKLTIRALDETLLAPPKIPADPTVGVMFAGLDPDDAVFDSIKAAGVPAILVNGLDPGMRVDTIAPANFFGGRLVAEHLYALGHRQTMMISTLRRWTLRRRIQGFQAGLQEFGAPPADFIELPELSAERAANELRKRLRAGTLDATAVFCGNDAVALGVIELLQAEGLSIPRDISVVGFDDLPFADLVSPRLTTVRAEWREMGQQAIALLEGQARRLHRTPLQVQAGIRLIVRETTAKR